MKITEILAESKQLNEGPLLNKIGDVIGKGVGGVGKGIGAVAGGVAGLGTAIKKGYRAGKATVAGGGDDEEQPTGSTTAPAVGTEPASKKAAGSEKAVTPVKPKGDSATVQGVKSGINKALGAKAFDVNPKVPAAQQAAQTQQATRQAPQAGAAQAPAQQPAQTPQAGAQQTNQLPAKNVQGGQTMYAQVKANIDKLDKKGKQRIMQLLQKSLGAPTAAPAAPKLGVAPTMSTVTKNWDAETGEPLTPKANAEYAKFSPEQKAEIEKNIADKNRKPAKPTQAEIDADREKIMGPTSDSIIRTAKPISESFSLYRKQ
jgi:hypothetical protein